VPPRPRTTPQELHKLLLEERLAGATLLILANKQDVAGALSPEDIHKASRLPPAAWRLAPGGGAQQRWPRRRPAHPSLPPLPLNSPRPAPPPQVLDLGALGSRHWRVAGCSAVSGAGLDGAFAWVVGDVASRMYLLE
jgi:ADP-ribosylation factor-like protein 2